jgi:predicted nucleic acid-binding Zn ribbon protein
MVMTTDWDRICQYCGGDIDYGRDDFCSDECEEAVEGPKDADAEPDQSDV